MSVGDEVAGFRDGDDAEQREHLVEQGASVAVGPDESLVDAHGERHGEEAVGGLNEQADGLQSIEFARLRAVCTSFFSLATSFRRAASLPLADQQGGQYESHTSSH